MNKDELIRIYSAYLPYQLRICDSVHNPDFILDEDNVGDVLHDAEHLYTIKPYLYDLSYLTKEIEHEGKKFVPQEILIEKYGIEVKKFDNVAGYNYFFKGFRNGLNFKDFENYRNQLLEWHFNIFQLSEDQFINKATLSHDKSK